jgi:hypothetical protein
MADPAARQLSALRGLALGALCWAACTQEATPTPKATAVPAPPIAMPAVAPSAAGSVAPAPADAGMPVIDPGPPPHTERVSLVVHALWIPVGSAEDPFADRLADVRCPEAAAAAEVLSEEPAFGVDTGMCNYLTARQVMQTYVATGETIAVRLWHFELDAPNPAEAHAAVDVGGVRVLDQRVAIPAPGGLVKASLVVDHAMPSGTPVHFHLHNHGANSWALVEISTGPAL